MLKIFVGGWPYGFTRVIMITPKRYLSVARQSLVRYVLFFVYEGFCA